MPIQLSINLWFQILNIRTTVLYLFYTSIFFFKHNNMEIIELKQDYLQKTG